MTTYKLAFLGFGNVGQALAELLLRKENELASNYNINFSVTGIGTGSHGSAVNVDGIDLPAALDAVRNGRDLGLLAGQPASDSLELIRTSQADVLFENTSVNHETGQPALDYVKAALNLGMHVCTANKGPVVHGYKELSDLADAKGVRFYHESTVMDGAPIFSLFRESIPASNLLSFKGILNSTTNLILSRLEQGDSFDEAVKHCQDVGIAETDPSGDVDGWDAAIKVSALVTVLMGIPLKPQDVDREGIRNITPEMVADALKDGKRYKLICSAERDGENVIAKVAPELIPSNSPIYSVEGTSSIVEFKTDVLGDLSVVEKDPGPHTTAYGLLADFMNAVK
ncbi:MAG: homoserine dehydrogenase [Anaerolineae bacterium]|nr:homoserine dehydrogenase [Anaerolineae bacterium]MBT4456921.1 homoserine dehydrogenase [Anaerolineae bacterium]MBT4841458.1 homoserine dehydrogenase [Anaerolineae bacterium]MBT6323898.1 homoserine dehydrogenase [Anaerolineae bacterium]MBT6811566.1 homoserine dehydrogenase [Anaerolineae bacterium]